MKPNLSLKFLEGVTEKLREENSDLRKEVESLRGVVGSLEQELRTLSIIVSENIERREAVETSLVAVEQNYTDLENQRKMSTAIELQAQYSRKNTLLLTGSAIPTFVHGQITRQIVVGLLREYLGLEVHLRAITACHRLSNRSTILVRFADLDERMAVYRQRMSPKKRGLLIHESLTNERLAVIRILQKLHRSRETSPFASYHTSMGRIFIRLNDPARPGSFKTLELHVGVTESEILDICGRQGAGPPAPPAVPARGGPALGDRRPRGGGGAVRGGGSNPSRSGRPCPVSAPGHSLGAGDAAVRSRAAGVLGPAGPAAGVPGSAGPAAGVPGSAGPAAGAPGSAGPAAGAPGSAGHAAAGAPGSAGPAAAGVPGSAGPAAGVPESAGPAAGAPGSAGPAGAPGSAGPAAGAPGPAGPAAAGVPGSAGPDAGAPGSGGPAAGAPGSAGPAAGVSGPMGPAAGVAGPNGPAAGVPGPVGSGAGAEAV